MSKKAINDGGPAFPVPKDDYRVEAMKQRGNVHGMTLRDYFAALAMQQMCAGPGAEAVARRDGRYDETNWTEVVAMNAYEFADAMIREREKKP